MNATRDDDALSWAGDDDPTLTPSERDTEKLPEGWSIPAPPKRDQTTGSALDADRDADRNADSEAAASVSSLALVSMGVLGGIYLLYTIGWFISTGRIGNPLADPVGQFMFSLGAWLAVAAPVIWFGVVFWLTTGRLRVLWLIIGVVLLAPLPLILGTGVSA